MEFIKRSNSYSIFLVFLIGIFFGLRGKCADFCANLSFDSELPRWSANLNSRLELNFNITNDNAYNIRRTASDYSRMLTKNFDTELVNLPENSQLVDPGAGKGLAILNYMIGTLRPLRINNFIAIGLRRPEDVPQFKTINGKTMRYLEGRLIEDIPTHEIGPTDIIAEVYGAFSYTASIDIILRKYLEILNVNRSAFIYFDPKALTVNFSESGLGEYLKAIAGAEFEWMSSPADYGTKIVLKMTKRSDKFYVPNLFLADFHSGTKERPYPLRFYLWIRNYEELSALHQKYLPEIDLNVLSRFYFR